MNNNEKETLKATIILMILILCITSLFFVFKNKELLYTNKSSVVNNLKDKTYYLYRYDKIVRKYIIEEIRFSSNNKKFIYRYYDLKNGEGFLSNCTKYLYSTNNFKIKLFCDTEIKQMKITYFDSSKVKINIEDKNYTYYNNIDLAYEKSN